MGNSDNAKNMVLTVCRKEQALPDDYKDMMGKLLGDGLADFMSTYSAPPTRSLRLNPLKTATDDASILSETGIIADGTRLNDIDSVPWCEQGYYYTDDITPGKHILHEGGAYYIQEASAMAPAVLLDPQPGEIVLDLCAAPGGKSTQIAGMMMGQGMLVSNEIIPKRADILSENIERMGVPNALVTNQDPGFIAEFFPEYFDKILVDAPCSGEGMFRKNPDAIGEWSKGSVLMCAARQKDILDTAAGCLRPGGRLVYSTCTFSKEENEDVIDNFLTAHPDYRLEEMHRYFPHTHRCEGHFAALLARKGKPMPPTASLLDNDRQLMSFGDNIYLLPEHCPDLSGLKVVRPGLHIGAIKKDRFEPAHALAMSAVPGMLPVPFLEVPYETAKAYIRGEIFSYDGKKGWYIICYHGISLGWGKCAAGVMKNHYPKGLRKNL